MLNQASGTLPPQTTPPLSPYLASFSGCNIVGMGKNTHPLNNLLGTLNIMDYLACMVASCSLIWPKNPTRVTRVCLCLMVPVLRWLQREVERTPALLGALEGPLHPQRRVEVRSIGGAGPSALMVSKYAPLSWKQRPLES